MLNRHQLRIKALQSLYAYHTAREANYALCQEKLSKAFEPEWDWEENKNTDTQLIKEQQKAAEMYFKKYYNSREVFRPSIEIDDKVYKNVKMMLSVFDNQDKVDKELNGKNLISNTEKIYDAYLSTFALFLQIAEFVAQEKIAVENSFLRKETEKGDFKFEKNAIIQAIKNQEQLMTLLKKRNISWEHKIDEIKSFYHNKLKNFPDYLTYHQSLTHSFEEDKEIVLKIIKTFIFPQKTTNTFVLDDIILPANTWKNWLKNISFNDIATNIDQAIPVTIYHFFDILAQNNFVINQKEKEEFVKKTIYKIQDSITKIKNDAFKLLKFKEKLEEDKQKEKEKLEKKKTGKKFDKNIKKLTHEPFVNPLEEKRPRENMIKQSLSDLIENISLFLIENELNNAGFLTKNIEYINDVAAHYLKTLDIEWSEKARITLQTKVENEFSYIAEILAENDVLWEETQEAVSSLIQKTIKSITPENQQDFQLLSLTKNWEDDKEFMIDLYRQTLDNEEEYNEYIMQKSQNWDIGRIAIVDKIILLMAINEMINCYSIPIKVSINEYLEIAKNYSTIKSKEFINGVLNSISSYLIEQKIIKKSALGMLDNK
jgi:N utilization substance protein B